MAGHVRHSHAAGREGAPGGYTTRPGRGGGRPPAMAVAAASPPHPQPGHPRSLARPPARPPQARRRSAISATRAEPYFRRPSQTGFMSAGGARVRAAILRCLSPALPFGELSPPPPRGASSSAP